LPLAMLAWAWRQAAFACGAAARRCAPGVPVAHGLAGRSGRGSALRR